MSLLSLFISYAIGILHIKPTQDLIEKYDFELSNLSKILSLTQLMLVLCKLTANILNIVPLIRFTFLEGIVIEAVLKIIR